MCPLSKSKPQNSTTSRFMTQNTVYRIYFQQIYKFNEFCDSSIFGYFSKMLYTKKLVDFTEQSSQ